jgi:hypothetical protein
VRKLPAQEVAETMNEKRQQFGTPNGKARKPLPPRHLRHVHDMMKPQLRFDEPVDNAPDSPFIPRLTYKPNALVPLALGLF